MTRRLLGILLFIAGILTYICLQHPIESPSLFSISIGEPVRFAPVAANERAWLVTDRALVCLASDGSTVYRSELSEPISGAVFLSPDQLVVLTAKTLTSYPVDRGEPLWQIPHSFAPTARVLEQLGRCVVFDQHRAHVYSKESRPVGTYEAVGSLTQVLMPIDDTLIALSTTKNASGTDVGRLSVFRPSTQAEEWVYPEPLAIEPVQFQNDQIFTCTREGQPVLIDVKTGRDLFRVQRGGYRLLAQTPSCLLLLAAGASRIETQPLSSGGAAWSVNSTSPIRVGFILEENLALLNDEHARIFGVLDGNLKLQLQPGSALIVGGPLGTDSIWLTYDDSLWFNTRYCSAYAVNRQRPLWTAGETKEGVWPPLALKAGDLVVSRNGRVRLFPRR